MVNRGKFDLLMGYLFPLCLCLLLPACNFSGFANDEEQADRSRPAAKVSTEPEEDSQVSLSAENTGKATPEISESEPLRLTLQEAILQSLDNNAAFQVDRLTPALQRTYETEERAEFDPVLSGEFSKTRAKTSEDVRGQADDEVASATSTGGALSLETLLPTGTTLGLEAGRTNSREDGFTSDTDTQANQYGINVTQPLLRSFGPRVNLANLRKAKLDTRISQYELQGLAEALVAEVEKTYWDYVLAERQIEIYTDSLEIAEQYINEIKERINIGKLAETELAAAEAEVARRREDLINANSNFANVRLLFIRLLNPGGSNRWTRELEILDKPLAAPLELGDVETRVQKALALRPEINEALLRIEKGDLEIIRTRNGLLPKLDLFIRLGNTSYSETFSSKNNLDGKEYAYEIGLQFEYALGNRAKKAEHERALLSVEQAKEMLNNLQGLVQVDVRSAYIEVERFREQTEATKATRKLREEALRVENEKFRVGKSTAFLVAQASRDLVASRISEVEAVVNHLKAQVDFFRLESSLLERRGIVIPEIETAK